MLRKKEYVAVMFTRRAADSDSGVTFSLGRVM
jgi:hypothetical protein